MKESIIECKSGDFNIDKNGNKYSVITTKEITVWGLKKINVKTDIPDDIVACIPGKKINNHRSLFRMILPDSDFSFYIFTWLPLIIKKDDVIADVTFLESRECYVFIDTKGFI